MGWGAVLGAEPEPLGLSAVLGAEPEPVGWSAVLGAEPEPVGWVLSLVLNLSPWVGVLSLVLNLLGLHQARRRPAFRNDIILAMCHHLVLSNLRLQHLLDMNLLLRSSR